MTGFRGGVVCPAGVGAVAGDLAGAHAGAVPGDGGAGELLALDRAVAPVLDGEGLEAADLGAGLGLGAGVGEGLAAVVGQRAQEQQPATLVAAQRHESLRDLPCFVISSDECQRACQMLVVDVPQRIDLDGPAILLDAFLEEVLLAQRRGKPAMIFRPLRTKLYRLAVKGRRLLLLKVDETHRGVGIAEVRIELNGPSSELRRFGARSIDRKAPVGRRVVRPKH